MAQIINEYRGLGNALGESLGHGLSGLGQGFGDSLNRLTQMKLDQISQREESKRAAKSYEKFGIPSNIAEALAGLSPEERKLPLQNIGALLQLGQAQQPQSASYALQGLEQPSTQKQATPQPANEQVKLIESLFTSPHEKREQENLCRFNDFAGLMAVESNGFQFKLWH